MAVRIIPAHAGFTVRDQPAAGVIEDHPRTRGVYRSPAGVRDWRSGSSPHTRGLRLRVHQDPTQHRIIPAHAGFTHPSGPRGPGRADHPRTRGVYGAPTHRRRAARGSSPHTRGLPPPTGPRSQPIRIIPAHAGFTSRSGHGRGPASDHPRTRGVYMVLTVLRIGPAWIIPAHAGFTRRGCHP